MSCDGYLTTGQGTDAAIDSSKVAAEETQEASSDQSHEELVGQASRQLNTNQVKCICFSKNLGVVLLKSVIAVKAHGKARKKSTEV